MRLLWLVIPAKAGMADQNTECMYIAKNVQAETFHRSVTEIAMKHLYSNISA